MSRTWNGFQLPSDSLSSVDYVSHRLLYRGTSSSQLWGECSWSLGSMSMARPFLHWPSGSFHKSSVVWTSTYSSVDYCLVARWSSRKYLTLEQMQSEVASFERAVCYLVSLRGCCGACLQSGRWSNHLDQASLVLCSLHRQGPQGDCHLQPPLSLWGHLSLYPSHPSPLRIVSTSPQMESRTLVSSCSK